MSFRLLSLGVNRTPFAKTALRFAELDAVRLARMFASSRGPVGEGEATTLLGPQATTGAVRAELDMLMLFPPDCLLFAWAGHGGDDGIALADAILTYDELAWRLGAIGARVKFAVFGTCHAGSAQRPFTTRFGGVGDIELAWEIVLLNACPGLRLFTAVGPNELAYEDATVQGGRFLYALMAVLRSAPGDIELAGYRWISDVSVLPRVRALLARRWPREALPSMLGPSGPGGPLPLLLSQVEQPIGSAIVTNIVPTAGVSIEASIFTSDRQFVHTHVEVTAVADDGTVFLSQRVPFLPNAVMHEFARRFAVDPGQLMRAPWTGYWLRVGLPVRLTWHVRVLDDVRHVLAHARFTHTYRRQARVA